MQDAFLSDNLVCDNLIGKEEKVLCRQRCKRKKYDQGTTHHPFEWWNGPAKYSSSCSWEDNTKMKEQGFLTSTLDVNVSLRDCPGLWKHREALAVWMNKIMQCQNTLNTSILKANSFLLPCHYRHCICSGRTNPSG